MAKNLAQEWPVRNDQIVLLLLGGMTQKEFANDSRALEVITAAREAITEKLLSDMDDQMTHAARLAIKSVRRTLEADISPVHKAKGNQDRVAVAVLRGRGFLTQENNEGEKSFVVTPAQFDRLVGSLAKADEAKKIDPFADIPEVEAVEVD